MIRGGARLALQGKVWERTVNEAIQRIVKTVQATPASKWHGQTTFTEIASTTCDDVLGKLTELSHDDTVGRCVVATEDIPKHTIVLPVDGVLLKERNTWTIQITKDDQLLSVGGAQLVAHSCQPNMHLLFDYGGGKAYRGSDAVQETLPALWYTSRRDIEKGERLSFDYNTSEWVVSDSFVDVNTQIPVEGFSKITDPAYRLRVLPYITPPVRQQALEEGLLTEEEAAIAGIFAKTMDA
eukprot:Rhum_TRINITY_DN14748_c16_g1::Rhum_TRINITY_DN14748_c16_g1_i1::g.114755::m.114755